VRHRGGVERRGQHLGDLHRLPADRLGQGQGGRSGPIAVVALLGRVDLHPAGRLRQIRVRKGSAHCEGEVVADHRSR
jgi:hypothetical protein